MGVFIILEGLLLLGGFASQLAGKDQVTATTLQNLSFIVNFEKSHLTPPRSLTYLGLEIELVSLEFKIAFVRCQLLLEDAYFFIGPYLRM